MTLRCSQLLIIIHPRTSLKQTHRVPNPVIPASSDVRKYFTTQPWIHPLTCNPQAVTRQDTPSLLITEYSNMDTQGEIYQLEDYFRAIKDHNTHQHSHTHHDALTYEGLDSSRHIDENLDRGNYQTRSRDSLEEKQGRMDLSEHLSDHMSSIDHDVSMISQTSFGMEGNDSGVGDIEPPKTHKLVLSKLRIDLSLLISQSTEQHLKIMNKNQFKINVKVRLRDQIRGVTLVSPTCIDRLSSESIHISIDEVEEIGDIFNAIIIDVTSEYYVDSVEVPFIIRYERPKLRLHYEGATCFLNFNEQRFTHITLKASTFREYTIHLSSAQSLDIALETPMTETTVFPDELMVGNDRRKVTIRTKSKQFCLVMRIKHTQLAFLCKVTLAE